MNMRNLALILVRFLGVLFLALGVRLLQGYGQTEASPVVSANPPARIKLKTVGPALKGVDFYSNLEVVYWLHQSRRDLVLQSPKNDKSTNSNWQ